MLLLKQDTTKKERVNKFLELKLELDIGKDKKYKVKRIKDNAVYNKAAEGQLPKLYDLVFEKGI